MKFVFPQLNLPLEKIALCKAGYVNRQGRTVTASTTATRPMCARKTLARHSSLLPLPLQGPAPGAGHAIYDGKEQGKDKISTSAIFHCYCF